MPTQQASRSTAPPDEPPTGQAVLAPVAPAPPVVDRLLVREMAIKANVIERTMRKRLDGEKVRGSAGDRCDRVLREYGLMLARPRGRSR